MIFESVFGEKRRKGEIKRSRGWEENLLMVDMCVQYVRATVACIHSRQKDGGKTAR